MNQQNHNDAVMHFIKPNMSDKEIATLISHVNKLRNG